MEEIIGGKKIKKTLHQLPAWKGKAIEDTYGGKCVLEKNGKPVFAEIFALEEYKENGFSGVWVDTFRKKFRIGFPSKEDIVELPQSIAKQLFEINNGKQLKGTWDLLLWKNEKIKFVEIKRQGKDKIRATQIDFLERALKYGFTLEDFEIYEWEIEDS